MNERKYQKPFKLDMDFDEALTRFTQVDPVELEDGQENALRIIEKDDQAAKFIVYASDHGVTTELRFDGQEPWFTYEQLAQIFGTSERNVIDHVKKFVDDGELEDSTTRKFRVVRFEGNREVEREISHFSLDVAFYVGYRVNSTQGALFRRWATKILVQVATKNYFIDKQKLKAPDQQSIIDELRDEIREIRAATANVYREVRRICSMCQDYDSKSQDAINFFASMENKLLWAATSHTAAELIMSRADASKPDMGLTYYTGKKAPNQNDVTTGNNYLEKEEARLKNRATNMLLDYFEEQLEQGRLVTMEEAAEKMDDFIRFNNWPLLAGYGRVKATTAKAHAKEQLKLFKKKLLN